MEAQAIIRPARRSDCERLPDIEVAAGVRFRDIGMPEIADEDPMSIAQLSAYVEEGLCWVAVDDQDIPVGYVVVDVVDGCAHIEQISVHPDHQRTGVGRALIAEIERSARENEMRALTLMTFEHVPWNAPLYAHLGFRRLADHELTDGLRAIRESEAAQGLDIKTRVCMQRDLS